MFFIYNGEFILDIFNKNQITIKTICTMQNVTKSIPTKKHFFWKAKKIENRPGVAEIGRKGSESFWDITTETFDTFP